MTDLPDEFIEKAAEAKDFHRESVAGAISAILPDLHELWMQEWEQVGFVSPFRVAPGWAFSTENPIPETEDERLHPWEPVYRRKAQP